MFSRITRVSRSIRPNSILNPTTRPRQFTTTLKMAVTVDADFISRITAAEKKITNSDEPAKGGPTAAAQRHVGQTLTGDVISDITAGEKKLTGVDKAIRNGPTSIAQSILSAGSSTSNASTNNLQHSGRLDSETMSKITEKEKQISGQDEPVKGGPTAQAQKHAGEPITSEALHDITEGEKKVTGGERVKGGPTSAAQSELGKSRS